MSKPYIKAQLETIVYDERLLALNYKLLGTVEFRA